MTVGKKIVEISDNFDTKAIINGKLGYVEIDNKIIPVVKSNNNEEALVYKG